MKLYISINHVYKLIDISINHVYKLIDFKSILLARRTCRLMVCVCPVRVSQVYMPYSVLDFEMYCCVIFPSGSMHIFAYFLRQLMYGVCGGLTLAVLQLVNGT